MVFDKVFEHYARKSSWSLSTLSHGELSWQKARKGLLPQDACDVDMQVSDIYKDAERIKIRRFLLSEYKDFKSKNMRITESQQRIWNLCVVRDCLRMKTIFNWLMTFIIEEIQALYKLCK